MGSEALPVIVVGAGLSGLSAAKTLHENGQNVLVLEANDRLGGRTFTRHGPKTNYVDMGGSYVCVGQDCILKLIEEFKLETFKVFNEGKSILLSGDKKYYYKNGAPILSMANPIICLDLYNYLRRFDKDCERINVDKPWESPEAEKFDHITMKQYIDSICWTRVVNGAANAFVSFNVCAEGREVSALYFLWFIKQRGGINRMFSNANQASKIVGGSQLLSFKMADLIPGCIRYNKKVISVTQTANQVVVKTQDGDEFAGCRLIMALSPSQQQGMTFEPQLPAFRNQLNQRMPMGAVIKVIIYYQTAFWRDLGFNGHLVSTTQTQVTHPLAYCLDDTKPDGDKPAIIGFLVGDTARALAELTSAERKLIVARSLKNIFNSDLALSPIHYEELNWMSDPYCGGCFVAFCFPGVVTGYGRHIRKPLDRMYFAGTETSTKWSGYMDGAIRSGQRAAREVLSDNGIHVKDESVKGFEKMKKTRWENNSPSINTLINLSLIGAAAAAIAGVVHLKYKPFF